MPGPTGIDLSLPGHPDYMELKEFLEMKHDQYNRPGFIPDDPVMVPHFFSSKQDIEISGFLTAVISWGNRVTIIKNARKLLSMMGDAPYDFLVQSAPSDFDVFRNFVHRTFQGEDCICFLECLSGIYKDHGGLEEVFMRGYEASGNIKDAIVSARKLFFRPDCPQRSRKHFADPSANSASKRINLFLRWMVRDDNRGVDFGLWKGIPPSALYCPLDIHTAGTARMLGLLYRKQNDWKAVEELTGTLRKLDATDPVKYDFALFGIGRYESIAE